MITADEAKQAAKDGILEKIKALATVEAVNEITESADEAETQFGRGLKLAKDAFDRACIEIDKIF